MRESSSWEDIGCCRAFRVTEGFQQRYGQWKVLDTPLSESGIVGAAIGAAMMGMRPVVRVQFADFISCAFDQITEMAAQKSLRTGGQGTLWLFALLAGRTHGGHFTPFVLKPGPIFRWTETCGALNCV
ncbi:MAG: hypothetical protein R3B95_06865 [Nitrospirales bacterium]